MKFDDTARLTLAAELSRKRRAIALGSPQRFAQVYLGHYLKHPASPMHERLYELLDRAARERDARIAVAAPRGHAKSTVVSLAYVLWAVVSGVDQYVLLASATKEQAVQHLKSVKTELETNALLHADFPEIAQMIKGRRPSPWRGSALQLPNGALIRAVGAGEQIRGTRQTQHRPSLIICDDLEMPEAVMSADQRRKMRDWFEKTLLKAGDRGTNVVLVGTVLHYDSLLAGFVGSVTPPGWTAAKFRALITPPDDDGLWQGWESIYAGRDEWDEAAPATGPDAARAFYEAHAEAMDAGAEVLWPAKESLYELMEMRAREGRASFDSEKQNEPLDPEQCLFRPESMIYWDDEHGTVENLLKLHGDDLEIRAAWDPSLGTNPTRGDFSAFVVVARHRKSKVCYVIAEDISRRTPAAMITRIVEYAGMYPMRWIAVEANGFQEELAKQLEKALKDAGLKTRVQSVKNTGNKQGRIELLEPLVAQGKVQFCRRHTTLLEQLRQFPLGAHDDGPDALQMAVTAAGPVKPKMFFVNVPARYPSNVRYYDI